MGFLPRRSTVVLTVDKVGLRDQLVNHADSGYISLSPEFRAEVSDYYAEQVEYGRTLGGLEGTVIPLPEEESLDIRAIERNNILALLGQNGLPVVCNEYGLPPKQLLAEYHIALPDLYRAVGLVPGKNHHITLAKRLGISVEDLGELKP